MTVPISPSVGNSVLPPSSQVTASPATKADVPFAELVKDLLNDTSRQQDAMQNSVKQLVSGETDSIHDVVLTASRADLAFRLVMEIRNRLISSYEEIMRMQV
ncbi:MAG: flagellar hook-basal body complex protein FliE [Planctomycetaceae bacterium]